MHNNILDIHEILNEYSQDIQDAITNEAQVVAKKGVDVLKNTSPKRTGKYRKGWRVNTSKGRHEVSCTIYNQNAGLTVLLEKPHKDRTGTRTITPKSAGHIKKVDDMCNSEFEKNVEMIIKNGG